MASHAREGHKAEGGRRSAQAVAWADVDLDARSPLRPFERAERENESSRRAGPPDWRNARAVVHPVVSAPLATPSAAARAPAHADTPPGVAEAPPAPASRLQPASLMTPLLAPAHDLAPDEIWPDDMLPRRTKLPDRGNRSPREAEENGW